jgi:hypothetical protein
MKLEHFMWLFLTAVIMLALTALFMGAKQMRHDREACEQRGGIQLEAPRGRVCASKDIVLREKP